MIATVIMKLIRSRSRKRNGSQLSVVFSINAILLEKQTIKQDLNQP